MEIVQPIRDPEKIDLCIRIARDYDKKAKPGEVSHELLFMIGFYTALRISDILRLRVKDVKDTEYVEIRAQKTGKVAMIPLSSYIRKQLPRLLKDMDDDNLLFTGRKRDSLSHMKNAITRQHAYRIINETCREAGIRYRVGCHTLRKTFGYQFYRQYKDIDMLQQMLQHSSTRDTKVYIGIRDDDKMKMMKDFYICKR